MKRFRRLQDESGLALLLVVTLLALVTMLVVSLAVMTRVETQRSGTVVAQVQARRNALLALDVALAKTQRLAGSDFRATGTATLMGAVMEQPYWSGVWSSQSPAATPQGWLVSGEDPNPAVMPTAAERRIVLVREASGEDDGDDAVRVPWVELTASDDGVVPAGGYAFYVADEGVKASLAAARQPAYRPTEIADQRQARMGGVYAVGFTDGATFDQTSDAMQARLPQLVDREQWRVAAPELSAADWRRRWHDYTAWSRGLLVDPVRGRLKQDLSLDPDAAVAGLAAWGDLATASSSSLLSPSYTLRTHSGAGTAILEPNVLPSVTQVVCQFSIHTGIGESPSNSRNLGSAFRFFIELHNPFSSGLEMENLKIRLYGLPLVSIETSNNEDDSLDHGSATVDLNQVYSNGADGNGSYVEFDLPFPETVWQPGRVIGWKMTSGFSRSEAEKRVLEFDGRNRTSSWGGATGARLDGPDNPDEYSEFRFTSAADFQIEIRLLNNRDEELKHVILPAFEPIESTWRSSRSRLPDFGFVVRALDRSDYQDAEGASSWLLQDESKFLRARVVEPSAFVPTIDLSPGSFTEDAPPPNSGVEARQLYNRDPSAWSGASYYQPTYNSDVALFELPHDPWISVGALQHLPFGNAPVYDVGNSWSSRNAWFDRFFFSTRTDTADFSTLPRSPHVSRIPEASGNLGDSATVSWVRDAFNLNSTSVEAWRAVLRGIGTGGLEHTFDYTTHDETSGEVNGTATQQLMRPVGRFAQSAGEMWESTPNPANYQDVLRIYRRGVRELTEAQVDGLAERIAANVARRGAARGPFVSVEDFLAADAALFGGQNLLEYSIAEYDAAAPMADRIQWDHTFADEPMKMDVAAPAYLTSADLMTALAPMLTTRSDTFVIRAYGEVSDPLNATEPAAQAWLEALVQRLPEPVDATEFSDADGVQMKRDAVLGRRFVIKRMRWLTEDEL